MNGLINWLNNILKAFLPENLLDTLGLSAFFEPDNRLYYPYLLSALIIAIAFFVFTKKKNATATKPNLLQYLFPKSIWLNKSAIVDYQIFAFNNILRVLLIAPYIMANLTFAYIVVRWWEAAIGIQDSVQWLPMSINICYTIVFLVISDFSRFFTHYLLHKIPFLWQFHKVHHSAEVLTPITLYREHPIEFYIHKLRSMFIFGLVAGSFFFWFRTGLEPITVLQIHIDLFIFNLIGANLRHSHIPISFGKFLEHIFISPVQHQIHHGNHPRFYDKNFGALFAFWDWMFGSLYISKPKEKIDFGIEATEQVDFRSFSQNLLSPFRYLFRRGSQ